MYYTKNSNRTDMKSSSSYVETYVFKNYVQGKGVSYVRRYKTIPELEKEIAELKNKPYTQEEYEQRLAELEEQIQKRRRKPKPRTRNSEKKTKTDDVISLRRSQKNLMLYLYGNFDDPFVLMATLTNAEKVYDANIMISDFSVFGKKFRRKFPNAVWLVVFDLHQDNSFHAHFIFKNARGATHEVLTKMWGKGMVYVSQFQADKIPYLCKSDEVLKNYPSGCKLFIKSNNCKMPKPVKLSVEKFEELTKDMECTSATAKTLYVMQDDEVEARAVNHFIYKSFKKKKGEL